MESLFAELRAEFEKLGKHFSALADHACRTELALASARADLLVAHARVRELEAQVVHLRRGATVELEQLGTQRPGRA